MLTRARVAKRLGRSIATVRRMEGNELHPWVDERGIHRFDEAEVDALFARNPELSLPLSASAPAACDDELAEARSALEDAEGEIARLKQRILRAEGDLGRAAAQVSQFRAHNQELRSTAIEALSMVETLLEDDTPNAVRVTLRDLRDAG